MAWRDARVIAGVLLLSAALNGCALLVPQSEQLRSDWPADVPERIELADVPFHPQQDYSCGPAALATSLGHFGIGVAPEELISQVYLPTRRGSLQLEMLAAARRHGMVSYRLAPRFDDVLREIAAGIPVIVLQDYGVWPVPLWHYAVAVGYDRGSRELILRSGEKRRLTIPFGVFEYTWKESGYWAMVVVPPDRLPASARESDYLTAIMAMERVGGPAPAAAAYASFSARWPDNPVAVIGRANSLHAAGELAQAELVLRKELLRHPASLVALNNLAQTVSDQGRQEEALRLIEQAHSPGRSVPASMESALRDTRAGIVVRLRAGGGRVNAPTD